MSGADRPLRVLEAQGKRIQRALDDRVESRDGIHWINALDWSFFPAAGSYSLARNAAGDYRASRTAAGAGTDIIACRTRDITRWSDAKGVKVLGFAVAFITSVVALSSFAINAQITTYDNAAGPTVAAYGGTQSFDSNHTTNAQRIATGTHLLEVTFADAQYIRATNEPTAVEHAQFSLEISVGMQNTGSFVLLGGGPIVAFDYT